MGDLTMCNCSSSATAEDPSETADPGEATAWMPCDPAAGACCPGDNNCPRRAISRAEAAGPCPGCPNFRRILSSPRSNSNSPISFSFRNSISSLNSFISSGVMNLSSASELRQPGGSLCHHLPTLRGNGNHIFNAHSKLTCNVDAGFDGDDHSRQKGLRLARGYAGCFMDFKHDTMTGGMSKVLSQASLAKDAARCFVYLSTRDTRLDRGNGRLLRLPHRIIREALPACWLPQEDSACHIGAITIENNTEVQG